MRPRYRPYPTKRADTLRRDRLSRPQVVPGRAPWGRWSVGRGMRFTSRFAADLGRFGYRGLPASFERAFGRAAHFRIPGSPFRVAIIGRLGVLYRWPWWAYGLPILVGIEDPATLGPLEPIRTTTGPAPDDRVAELSLPPMRPPTPRPPRRVDLVEIKGLRSYRTGLRQLAARKQPGGDTSLVVYDDRGNVHMQVFGVRNGTRQIVWEGIIGRVPPPPRGGTVGHGNAMEPLIRPLVERTTGQTFLPHRPNAGGPDLVMPGVPWR
jgi:hypothetical protein